MKSLNVFLVVFFTILTISAVPAYSLTITLDAVDSGWFRHDGKAQPINNQNYIVGRLPASGIYRNFFVFDLSGIKGKIFSAELRLYNPSSSISGDYKNPPNDTNGYQSPQEFETYTLFDVVIDIRTLTSHFDSQEAFDDLGTGKIYGNQSFSAADNGTLTSIILNSTALFDMKKSKGLFALGGVLTSLSDDPGVREHMFGFTAGQLGGSIVSNTTRQLVIETVPRPVPEPSTFLLLGGGLAGLALYRRKMTKRNLEGH